MKILFVIGNLDSGGAEKVISTLANSFSINHIVEILMISSDKNETFYKINPNIKIVPLLSINKKLSYIKKIKKIREEIISFSPDVVISFLNYVIVYSWLAIRKIKKEKNIKFIVSERNDPRRVPSIFLYRKLRNHIFSNADGCVFQTNDANDYFKKTKSSIIIPNPVFLTQKKYFDYKKNERDKTVLMVGSSKKEKNRFLAYKAFSIFNNARPDYKMMIVGSKPSRNELSYISKLGIGDKLIFSGRDNKWHSHYQSASMFILTSNFEGMPNALLEAAALQIPCISTDCPIGGPREILKNGERGILVNVGDCKKFAEAMLEIANNRSLQNHYSNQCLEISNEYSAEKISDIWIHYIKSI